MALLEGFLVRLGFEVDEDSASKMKDTARKAGEAVASIGKKAAGMGMALGAAVLKASSDLSKMYMTASRSGTSVGNIRAMGYALSQVGGDSEQAMQSIETLRTKFRDMPGLARGFSSAFNVNAIDKQTGKMRDMVDIMTDLGKQWRNMSDAAVSQQAAFLGIDPTTAELIKSGEFEKFYKEGLDMQAQMGVNLDDAAKRSAQFMSDINSIWETFKVGSMDLLTTYVGDWMHNFAKALPGLFGEFKKTIGDFFSTLFGEDNIITGAFKAFRGLFGDDEEEDKTEEKKPTPRVEAGKREVLDSSVNSGDDYAGLTDDSSEPDVSGLESGDDYLGLYKPKREPPKPSESQKPATSSPVKESANEFGSKAYYFDMPKSYDPLLPKKEAPQEGSPAALLRNDRSSYLQSPTQAVTTSAAEKTPESVQNDNRQNIDNSQSSSSSVQVQQSIVINAAGASSAEAIQKAAYDGTQSAIRDSSSVIR